MSEWTTARGAATCAQDDRRLGHLLVAHEGVERGPEAEDFGVMADQLGAVLGDGVDGARALGLVREAVQHGHDALLVRDADAGSQVVVAAEGLDGVWRGPTVGVSTGS